MEDIAVEEDLGARAGEGGREDEGEAEDRAGIWAWVRGFSAQLPRWTKKTPAQCRRVSGEGTRYMPVGLLPGARRDALG